MYGIAPKQLCVLPAKFLAMELHSLLVHVQPLLGGGHQQWASLAGWQGSPPYLPNGRRDATHWASPNTQHAWYISTAAAAMSPFCGTRCPFASRSIPP